MYRCESCGRRVGPNVQSYRVVTAWRDKTYPHRREANAVKTPKGIEYRDDPGGAGIEAVAEKTICPPCNETRLALLRMVANDHRRLLDTQR